MKIKLELGGSAGRGYLIHPRTGEAIACQWELTYRREVPHGDPFSPHSRFLTVPHDTICLEVEFPDDWMAADQPAAAASPALMSHPAELNP